LTGDWRDESARILGQALAQIAGAPVVELAEFQSRREALAAVAYDDGIAVVDDLVRVRDDAEAERFRLETERDLKGEDE
jgi:hypothetical protein